MKKNWAYKLLERNGWTINLAQELPSKCVICVAPHTSNWDFIIGILVKYALHIKANFFMKKEWFFFPMGYLMRSLGGIAIQRDKKLRMTDQMAAEFEKHETLCVAITPEGTRSYNPDWKKGFYFIAEKAGVPIVFAALDFKKKEIKLGEQFIPTGDVDADMMQIKAYFKDVNAKFPEKFAI
jgi:1-acyl-sn-glycerol-3-phosphate acyltransferase